MNDRLISAAQALADVLGEENEALAKYDLRAAALLLPRKERAILALQEVQCRTGEGCGVDTQVLQQALAIGEMLRKLAEQNRELLSQGLEVQSQVIAMVTQAARLQARGSHPARGYSAAGRMKADPADAYALVARA